MPSSPYRGDWSRMAKVVVHQSLQTQPGERVVLWADPTYFPELTEQIRIEILKAGAVEVCTMQYHSPALKEVRDDLRRRETPALREMEDAAMRDLMALADIFLFLPNDWWHVLGQTEEIIARGWPGRAVHMHWVPGWWPKASNPDIFRNMSEIHERAMYVDYRALKDHCSRLIEMLRGTTVEVKSPAGTDIAFEIPSDAHFSRNDGDASKEWIDKHAKPGSARDREEELPAGLIRTTDVTNVRGRLVVPKERAFPFWWGRDVGTLTFEFANDRVTRIRSEFEDEWLQAMWGLQTGDKDRMGEFMVGVNPELGPVPGYEDHGKILAYFGSGAGVVRFSVGNNLESGGRNNTSFFHNFLWVTEANVTSDGRAVVENGRLVL